jgi:serine/threonine protein kinase
MNSLKIDISSSIGLNHSLDGDDDDDDSVHTLQSNQSSIQLHKNHPKHHRYAIYPLRRLELLGKGSSSHVYKTIYWKSCTICAEKVLVSSDPSIRTLFIRELESLKKTITESGKKLCANIVHLLDVVPNPRDGTISLCLEYMDGGSLQDIVNNGGCQIESVLRGISKQILNGLKFLNDLQVY